MGVSYLDTPDTGVLWNVGEARAKFSILDLREGPRLKLVRPKYACGNKESVAETGEIHS